MYCEANISSIRSHLEKAKYKYITYPKFFFLCGKGFKKNQEAYWCSNRGVIHKFIEQLLPDAHIVLSEEMWEDGFDSSIDLLTFEEFLAEISDAIILFAESPGSFCELGAFTYAEELFSHKLIIVMDESHQHSRAFVSTGPVLKAQKNGSKIVYAQTENGALLSSRMLRTEIVSLIDAIKTKKTKINKRSSNVDARKVNINSFVIEFLELLRITQPIAANDLLQLYKTVKDFNSFTFVKSTGEEFNHEIEFSYILKLLQRSKIIKMESSIIELCDYKKTQNLMLRYDGNSMERERNRIICKKYRYGGHI